ncbi:hypothetical protein [Nonomuraea sp. NPDC003804]|uniref:hypothetical protein n=1 Tax=Nonomuraea sp. NPDC003804 TaxID=3154547 RepID=UPI00339DC9B0
MNTSRTLRRLATKTMIALAATALWSGAGLMAAGAAGAQAGPPPGLPRMHAYCQHLGHLNSVATDPGSVWSWRCVGHRGEHHGINMHDACRWHYDGRLTRAAFHNVNDAFSWYCY